MTLSSTVNSRKKVVAWNVRAMPRRQISEGRNPEMRSPLKWISPEVTGNTPVIRLNTVLLPAPFGPIRPWIVPALTVIENAATACRPPNRLPTSRSSRSNAGPQGGRPVLRPPPAEAAGHPPGQRHQPVREAQHHNHQH